jgi:hypothetical protein
MADSVPPFFERRCLHCGSALVRRLNEKLKHFEQRKHCNRQCLNARVSHNVEARFIAKTAVAGADECWLWQGQRWPSGHGIMLIRNIKRQATHVSLELSGKPRPGPDAMALHSCDNPPCVNPAHLRWGDHGANMADMVERGRGARLSGAKNAHAKLTDDLVRDIRRRDRSLTSWSKELGVGLGTLSMARSGKTWGHVR